MARAASPSWSLGPRGRWPPRPSASAARAREASADQGCRPYHRATRPHKTRQAEQTDSSDGHEQRRQSSSRGMSRCRCVLRAAAARPTKARGLYSSQIDAKPRPRRACKHSQPTRLSAIALIRNLAPHLV
eukprot:6175431-Pleurochrysis_carterae.AAC.1